ncbi:lipopolysaccharide heptosyltransferase RfaC [Amphritea pacifica]|uniref:Lipopolysaccharide heptosyltransferase 1 n=1 Tax=Amphritea pacifica TaxID=2811233 RepID=A0ABS2W9H3_9GAMM|nr:lipopolysaccharide heptosyltransferase RfaC [Amphritea pacifica]MBN0988369.1 lipopolysaccharide heptosyltransferase RfaC [Amphritea pacifica]MBN1006626.1 lipopolysaccharide heptosyltransferase RfaC [Amphritea pacifica]
MKVLIVKTSSMGDVIHTLPALTDAVNAIPGIRFDWVVEEGFAEIPQWHFAVDKVIPVAIRRWRKNLWKTFTSGEWKRYRAALSETDYDLVIDAQGLLKSAMLVTRYSRGVSCGYDKHSARESQAAWFYQRKINVSKDQHAVERTRQLFAGALGYEIQGRGDFAIRKHFMPEQAAASDYLVFLHSTTRFDKHWPELYWLELIDKATTTGWKIKLPWGNPDEKARAERLARHNDAVEVLPKLNLAQVTQVLAGAAGCVSVDTGLSHMAAALDRPNVILFGPTDPGLVGGYGKDQICLEAKTQADSGRDVEPAVFANLTPEIVWRTLTSQCFKVKD